MEDDIPKVQDVFAFFINLTLMFTVVILVVHAVVKNQHDRHRFDVEQMSEPELKEAVDDLDDEERQRLIEGLLEPARQSMIVDWSVLF